MKFFVYPVRQCRAHVFQSGVSAGRVLSGITGDTITKVCEEGYVVGFDDFANITSIAYTCTGAGDGNGTSQWIPTPSDMATSCQRKYSYKYSCSVIFFSIIYLYERMYVCMLINTRLGI